MDHITKLYKNKFLILQERYSALQEEYDILVENETKNGWVKITVPGPNGKSIGAWHNTETGEYKFDDADVEPITPASETLMGKIEEIPVAGPILGAAIKTATEKPVLAGTVALGAGIGSAVLANKRLATLEKQRSQAIAAGKEIASEKLTDVPGIANPVSSEFKPVKGEKPISTARSFFGISPEKDVRPSSRVYREFNPTLTPTVTTVQTSRVAPATQVTTANYSSPDLPGETFKLDTRTGEMVPNKTWTSGRQNAPRFKALETLGKVVGVPTLALGAYGTAEDIAAGEVPSVGNVAQLGAGTAMVAPKTTGKAIAGALTKIAPATAAKIGLKKIPLVGAAVGLGLAAERASAGDWLGAAGEAASGIAGTVPGLGTAVSAGIDAALLARDLSDTTEDEEKKKQEILKLQMGNATKPSEVKVVGPKM